MPFIIRMRTSQGMHRFTFSSGNATFNDLQTEIEKKYAIAKDAQVISKTPLSNPDFIEKTKAKDTLSSMGLKHGDMLYLAMVQNQINDYKQKQEKTQKNTSNKTSFNESKSMQIDNDNDNEEKYADEKAKKFKLKALKKRKNENYAKQVTLATSKVINDFQNKLEEKGPKHVPFHSWIEERQRKFANQPWNIDPPKFDYRPRPYSSRISHAELPPNAYIKRQDYRHVDLLTFKDSTPYQKFKKDWESKDSSVQRCAYLIGKYELVDNTIFKQKNASHASSLMCAKVYALYEPPQKGHGRGVKLLKDPNEEAIDAVINECGMFRIGIVFTTLPRGGKKYNGSIFMSGSEIFISAMLQNKYCNANTGYSKFVTLITHIGDCEAQCFMVSDQCMSMAENGLISAGTTSLTDDKIDNYGFMQVNLAPNKTALANVINENARVNQGDHFAPDALLVNVIATVSKQQEHVFRFVHFPNYTSANIDLVRQHLIFHKTKPFHVKLSDFKLLTFLTKIIDLELVKAIAKHVVQNKPLDQQLNKKVFTALKIAVPGWA